jgi:hypothetical protein
MMPIKVFVSTMVATACSTNHLCFFIRHHIALSIPVGLMHAVPGTLGELI